jgi:hypothetical protein
LWKSRFYGKISDFFPNKKFGKNLIYWEKSVFMRKIRFISQKKGWFFGFLLKKGRFYRNISNFFPKKSLGINRFFSQKQVWGKIDFFPRKILGKSWFFPNKKFGKKSDFRLHYRYAYKSHFPLGSSIIYMITWKMTAGIIS